MKSTGYVVCMRVRVLPEKRAEFIRLISQLIRDVKANEPETLIYEVAQSSVDPDEFVFFERFTSEAAYEKHRQAPYHVAMSSAGWACVSGDVHVEVLTPIA